MTSARLVQWLRKPRVWSASRERAERSFFIWHAYAHDEDLNHLSILGIINGFLRHLPRRLVVRGDHVGLERYP